MKNSNVGKGLLMWSCAALFYGFQFIIRVSPGSMVNEMMTTLAIDACILGSIISAYYYGYAFMQIPAGLLIDRVGARLPLTVACILCAGGCFIFSYSNHLILLTIGRLLMGIGSAFGLLSCIKISSVWLPPRFLTLFVGLALVIGTTGAVGGGYPLTLLINIYGWQKANLFLGIFSLVFATATFLLVKDSSPPSRSTEPKESTLISLKGILSNPQTWFFGLYGMLMYTPLSAFADLWGPPFIQSLYQVDALTAAQVISVFYIGVGIGGPVWSMVLTYFQKYRITMLMSAFLSCLIFVVLFYFPPQSFFQANALYAFAGFLTSGQFVAFGGVTDINLRTRTAAASGTHNMLCMLSGVILQPLIGQCLNWVTCGNGYCALDYQKSLFLIPLCLMGACLTVFFIKEVYNREEK